MRQKGIKLGLPRMAYSAFVPKFLGFRLFHKGHSFDCTLTRILKRKGPSIVASKSSQGPRQFSLQSGHKSSYSRNFPTIHCGDEDEGLSHCNWSNKPLSLNPMESSLATQDVPNLKFPGDESSLLVGVPISKGVASPREASNQKLKGCFFHRKPLSSLEELCISSRGSSPNPKPSTPPVGRFSN
ncbi:hypothetical protein CK203_058273 [Vitis vinifera]|uniref:Uncharacterized protein n=1 Tax=Vitis vinifera TaxID=29760 RepID=A0A438FTN4_VITVI|nr:hypothetical protein CK203_058273 [Vitis vinifera]